MSPPAVLTRLVDEASVPAVREIRPADLRVNPEFAVLLSTFAWTLIVPELSTITVPEAIAVTRSLFKILAVSGVLDPKTPLMNTPSVDPDDVILTVEAVKGGVVIEFDAVEGLELPTEFVALTVKV
jgi:hypothetical protein